MHGYHGFSIGCIYLMGVVENRLLVLVLGVLAVTGVIVGYIQK